MTKARLTRRRFLAGTIGAAAGAASLWTGIHKSTAAGRGPRVKVLVEDVRQTGRSLGGGAPGTSGALKGPAVLDGVPVASPFPFTHAGVHWRGSVSSVEVRTSRNGRRWTDWQPLDIEAAEDETPSGETFATLLSAPRHRMLQARVVLGDGDELETITTTFLNSVDGPALTTAATADPSGTPVTFTREDWGADESLRFSNSDEIWPRMFVPVKKLVVHHTATTNSYSSLEEATAEVRAIYTYHAVTLGWGDIGYNALIDKFGNVYEGRYGRELDSDTREVLSSGVTAGHALSHNYGSAGLALLGSHTKAGEGGRPGVQPSSAAQSAALSLLAFEAQRNDVDPQKATDFLLFDDTWNRGLENVSGHRDCNSTICPGGYVYDLLPDWRLALADQLARSDPAVSLVTYPPEETVDGGNPSYSWEGSAADLLFAYVLEGWQRIGTSEDINYLEGFTGDHRLAWSAWSNETTASFTGLADGHYTFHVRAQNPDGNIGYQDTRTLLMATGSGGDDPEEPPPAEEGFVLEAQGRKERGLQKADLTWTGADPNAAAIDVLRDGVLIATVENSGSYTDHIDTRGGGSYTYQLRQPDGLLSNEATVSF